MRNHAAVAILAALSVAGLPSFAQVNPVWTAVPSTGVPSPASIDGYHIGTASFGFLPTSTSISPISARFNVTNLAGSQNPAWSTLELGYFDDNVAGSIEARLVRIAPVTGSVILLCSVFSADNPTVTSRTCTWPSGVDFTSFLYMVELRLYRSSALVNPLAYSLRIY